MEGASVSIAPAGHGAVGTWGVWARFGFETQAPVLAAREFARSFSLAEVQGATPATLRAAQTEGLHAATGRRGSATRRVVRSPGEMPQNDGIRRIPRRGDKYVARYGEYSLMFGFETKQELRDQLQKVEQRENSYTDSTPC